MTTAGQEFIVIAIGATLALRFWIREHRRTDTTEEREANCPHKPEWQQTIRVNSILTINPALIHRVIPGRRWLAKECRGCGRQVQMYAPTLQPFDEFVAEFDQETIDRAVQLQARTQAHIREQEHAKLEKERKRQA